MTLLLVIWHPSGILFPGFDDIYGIFVCHKIAICNIMLYDQENITNSYLHNFVQ